MRTRSRRVLRLAASGALAVLTLAGLAAAGVRVTGVQANTPAPSHVTGHLPANRPTSGRPLVVAVALGRSGTVGSDALAPYEVFARSSKFSVYTAAATADAVPTQSGPFIVPTYTFADTATGRAPHPDVVVVPAVDDPDGPQEAPLRAWIADQADREPASWPCAPGPGYSPPPGCSTGGRPPATGPGSAPCANNTHACSGSKGVASFRTAPSPPPRA